MRVTPEVTTQCWKRLSYQDTTGSLATRQPVATAPDDSADGGIIKVAGYPLVRFIFMGENAEGETGFYSVHLWTPYARDTGGAAGAIGKLWIPFYVAGGVLTLGSLKADSTAVDLYQADRFFADTITETTSFTGSVAYSAGANTIAILEVATHNAEYADVQTDINTAANFTVLGQVGDQWI